MPDSALKTAVQTQMITAMKAGDKNRTQVLRMLLSEIKAKEADDIHAQAKNAVAGYGGKLKKALVEMEKLGQEERAAQLRAEIAIVDEFSPKPMDDAALAQVAGEALAGMGPLTAKEMGKAIGAVMKAVAAAGGTADSGKVRAIIESKIG